MKKEDEIGRFIELDEETINLLYKQLYVYARKYVGSSVSNDDLVDLIQDSILSLYTSLKSDKAFSTSASVSSYLFAIFKSKFFTYLKRTENLSKPYLWNDLVEKADDTTEHNQLNLIDRAISEALNEKEILLIKLYYHEQKSIEEIADILGISKSSLRVSLYRAKEKISSFVDASNPKGDE